MALRSCFLHTHVVRPLLLTRRIYTDPQFPQMTFSDNSVLCLDDGRRSARFFNKFCTFSKVSRDMMAGCVFSI